MKHLFEIYILADAIPAATWDRLYKGLLSQLGVLAKFEVIFSVNDNIVRFFISSDKDLGMISNNLEGIVLRPIDESELAVPTAHSKERLVQFVTGGNLLDLKEKYSVKKGKDLKYAVFKVRSINAEKAAVKYSLYFENVGGSWSVSNKIGTNLPSALLAVDFAKNTKYLKKSIKKYLNIEKSVHMFNSDKNNALFEVDAFPYFAQKYYLNLNSYEFDKHSFIIGASGSGKSKLIGLFIDRLQNTAQKMNYRVVVIDPHASLADELSYIQDKGVITFDSHDSTDLFPGAGTDLAAATELTATLFKSILGDQFNARLDRLLKYSLFVLMTAQAMSLENLKRLMTDATYRIEVTDHVKEYVPHNVIKFFGADYNEIRTQYYNETILPIVTMIEEMQLQPSLVGESDTSLAKTIEENFLTVFSLNKVSMGDKVVKTIAGLLVQQVFLLAQARVFGQKIILIIDEVSVVQNPTLAQILSEARKFNLTVILTQQYFGQVEKDLRDAIFANVYNYYAFKVSEEDARALEGNLNIDLPKEIIESEAKKGVKESDVKVKIMTELSPRECIVRVLSNGQNSPGLKVRTVDVPKANHGVKKVELQAVKQILPEKFTEGKSKENRTIKFSDKFLDQILEKHNATDVSEINDPDLSDDIRELLAAHSSSRKKLKRKKG